MHELGIVTAIVEVAEEKAEGERVRRIAVEVGTRAAVLADALRFSFEVAAEGTLCEGAGIEIVEVEGDGIRVVWMEVG